MDKYRQTAEKRLGNTKSYGHHKVHPDELARQAHVKGHFASQERENFFDEVYGEVLVDYFLEWLKTESHSAMALGSVKAKMIGFEMYGKNVPHIQEDKDV